jgi:hypothetical protein
MVRVRDVWPEAPTPEFTLLAGGIDHELEELVGHLRLSIYGARHHAAVRLSRD